MVVSSYGQMRRILLLWSGLIERFVRWNGSRLSQTVCCKAQRPKIRIIVR
jgi:hypothetical protein